MVTKTLKAIDDIYIVIMTRPKYQTLEDVPKFQHFGKKRYPIPMKKRIDMYLNQS